MSVRKRRVIFAPGARLDLSDIQLYSEQRWGKAQRAAYRRKIIDATDRLAQFPFLGTDQPNLAPGLRAHPVDSHVIYYIEDDRSVRIVRILHVKMDAAALLGP